MIIQKWKLFLADIEASVDRWGQSIVGGLEKGIQDAYEHVGRIFEVR